MRAPISGPRPGRRERGSALVVVLMVLTILFLLSGAYAVRVFSEIRVSRQETSSIEAFHLAEAGLEAGQLAFEQANQVYGIPTVTGSIGAGTFEVRPGVGDFGNENWLQWGYDEGMSRHNRLSDVGAGLRIGWATQKDPARNGSTSGSSFYVNNLYTIVASGLTYFTYEDPNTGRIQLAAFDELDGSLLWTTETTNLLGDGLRVSPLAAVEETDTLYFTYTSRDAPDGTVHLLALTVSAAGPQIKWDFDTGRHGIGTAPAIYNPHLEVPHDEIIYFAMVESPDWPVTNLGLGLYLPYPLAAYDAAEQIYCYAVADTGASETISGKWEHPFPDPDVVGFTDYPTEPWNTPVGSLDRVSEVNPLPPEEDPVVDYYNAAGNRLAVRGDLYIGFDPHSLGSPTLLVDDGGTPGVPADDTIHLYLYYTTVTDRDVTYYAYGNTPPSNPRIFWQAEVLALQDTPAGRFPQFKWTANPPAHDRNPGDGRPWNDYGKRYWQTWFEQQISPMVNWLTVDQAGTPFPDRDGDGQPDRYPVVYLPYESLGFASYSAYSNTNAKTISYGQVMALRDTWRDYALGWTTDPDQTVSRPVEWYWYDAGGDGPGPYTARPYVWSETDLDNSGELGVGEFAGITASADLDVEGETMAFDKQNNVFYFVFNHDLRPFSRDAESLRMHAINAVSGQELWRNAVKARLAGDAFNATPALAGGFLFFTAVSPGTRTAVLHVLNANDGTANANSPVTLDDDADAANVAPTIANDAVYVGTYDRLDLVQRLFGLSPNIWLVSTGVSADGRATRTLALKEQNGQLTTWKEGGFRGDGPTP